MDGLRRLVGDNRMPPDTPIRLPVRNTDAIVITSSPLVPPTPHFSDDSSDMIASSPQSSACVPKKMKVRVDSSSLPPNDDDIYVADPKPKRSKAGQRAVVATS